MKHADMKEICEVMQKDLFSLVITAWWNEMFGGKKNFFFSIESMLLLAVQILGKNQ